MDDLIIHLSLQIGFYVLLFLRNSQFDGHGRQRSQGLQIDDLTHRLE